MKNYKYLLLLIIVTFVMGAEFPVIKIGLKTIPPLFYIGMRFLIAFLILLIVYSRQIRNEFSIEMVLPSVILSIFLFMGFLTANYGIKNTTATNSGFYISLVVLITPILESVLFREPIANKIKICIAVCLVGIYLISTDSWTLSFNFGDLLCIASAFFYSLHIMFTSIYVKKHNPLIVSLLQIGFVSVWGYGASFICENTVNINGIGFYGWISLLFTGIIATAFVYTIQSFAQTEISSSNIGIIYSLEPVFAAVLSSMMLGEKLGIKGIFGGALIVSSAILYNISMLKVGGSYIDS